MIVALSVEELEESTETEQCVYITFRVHVQSARHIVKGVLWVREVEDVREMILLRIAIGTTNMQKLTTWKQKRRLSVGSATILGDARTNIRALPASA